MVAQKELPKSIEKEDIPASLVYETIDGKPYYRKGYRDVLNKTKTIEEIMACSSLQAFIIEYILDILFTKIGRKNYRFFTNEIGVHIDHRDNLASDIGIYDKQVLTPEKINVKYTDVPAKVFVEVDIKAELADTSETGYIRTKSQKLIDFGAERIIWILSQPRLVIVATNDGGWSMSDWGDDVELVDGNVFNVGAYLEREGVKA